MKTVVSNVGKTALAYEYPSHKQRKMWPDDATFWRMVPGKCIFYLSDWNID